MKIDIVEAKAVDMADLPNLIRQLYPDLPAEIILKRLPRMAEMTEHKILLGKSEGKTVAYLGYMLLTNLIYADYYWVQDLIVEKEYRSQGLGKIMLDHLKELARKNRVSHIALAANKAHLDAQRFYEEKMDMDKRGFIYRTRDTL